MQRVFAIDVLACARVWRRLRLDAVLEASAVTVRILRQRVMVRKKGLEPSRPCWRQPLNLVKMLR